jgi:hypothetical protein
MKSFPSRLCWAAIAVAVASSVSIAAAKAESSPAKPAVAGQAANEARDPKTKAPKVVRVRNGDDLSVEIVDLKDRLAKQPGLFKTMKLFLDCQLVENITAVPCLAENKVLFTLDQAAIEKITARTKVVSVGVSFNDPQNAELVMPEKIQLVLITYDFWFYLVTAIVLVLAFTLWCYGRRTSLLRDGRPPEGQDPSRAADSQQSLRENEERFRVLKYLPGFDDIMPKRSELAQYSLAKTQMAWWLFFIIATYLYIWVAVGDFNTLTSSTLILFGISIGTTVGSKMVDAGKQAAVEDLKATKKTLETQVGKLTEAQTPEAAAKSIQLEKVTEQADKLTSKPEEAKTKGFLIDIMSDENGVSIHRFQMVVWTVVLTIIFVYEVCKNLSMPEFSNTLLTLMGISSGTYVTLKVPEKKSVVDRPSSAS